MPPVALVSFTQASPDQPAINFYLNANRVNGYPLSYGGNLDYFQAFAGKRTANFYNAGTSNTILSDTVTFNQNAIYSLFLAGNAAQPELVVLKDTLSRPAAGKARSASRRKCGTTRRRSTYGYPETLTAPPDRSRTTP